jgi:hypothetical protein
MATFRLPLKSGFEQVQNQILTGSKLVLTHKKIFPNKYVLKRAGKFLGKFLKSLATYVSTFLAVLVITVLEPLLLEKHKNSLIMTLFTNYNVVAFIIE